MSKKCKKTIAVLISLYMIIVSLLSSICFRTYAFSSNDPRIYVNIVYEDGGTIRADVMFENMPNLKAGGFQLNVGEGWHILPNDFGDDGLNKDSRDKINNAIYSVYINNKGRFIGFCNAKLDGYNYNGRFCYFYIERTSESTPLNSVINCSLDSLYDADFTSIIETADVPVMLASYEYMIGDADGNGIIDARDASLVYTATDENMSYDVYSTRYTYTNEFPNAVCSASPDANEDGIIDSSDATLILRAYVNASSVGNVGEIAIYELFQ